MAITSARVTESFILADMLYLNIWWDSCRRSWVVRGSWCGYDSELKVEHVQLWGFKERWKAFSKAIHTYIAVLPSARLTLDWWLPARSASIQLRGCWPAPTCLPGGPHISGPQGVIMICRSVKLSLLCSTLFYLSLFTDIRYATAMPEGFLDPPFPQGSRDVNFERCIWHEAVYWRIREWPLLE